MLLTDLADICADPHYREGESIIEVPSEVGPLPQPAGQHTDEVLACLLGMSQPEIAALRDARVV
jgi:crotonobetainyl-CoA:carnitine CoA-transferase CaiB-like acyl-CoA transferase